MRVRAATGYGTALLALAVLVGVLTHAFNDFHYPLYLTDEGIYAQQAWAVVHEGRLSPYTYVYDHAPGGWLLLAIWNVLLPGQSGTFGNGINTGRVLMLIAQLASTVMLFQIARKVSGNYQAAFIAALLFNISPLAIYYQRQVLLDNMMVFWLLLCLYLLVMWNNRVLTTMAAGLALGVALVTKENAIFFVPVLIFLVRWTVRGKANRRFAESFWLFASLAPLGGYITYSILKGELLPEGLSFNLNNPPGGHVSLLYTVWWQLNRSQTGQFNQMLYNTWMPKDRWLLLAGVIAVGINVYLGWRLRHEKPALLVIPALAIAYAFYMVRGSVMLEFYILPIIPLLALNIGMAAAYVMRAFSNPMKVATVGLCLALLMTPAGGYFFVYNDKGALAVHDLYTQPLTDMQAAQVDFIRTHIPPNARIIMDDDLWMQLHEGKPYYAFAHSHWKAASDPTVKDAVFHGSWQNIDYVVMSNGMHAAMQGNGNQEGWMLEGVDFHSHPIWDATRGNVHLEILQIDHEGASGQ